MRSRRAVLAALFMTLALPARVSAQAEMRRSVLVAGANVGGADRPVLRYAVSDAERFAQALTELGGVAPANAILLKEPKVRDFVQALDQLSRRASAGKRQAGGGRAEVLVYYSGHADEKGLLPGDDRYSYQSLRDRLDEIPADVTGDGKVTLNEAYQFAFNGPLGTRKNFSGFDAGVSIGWIRGRGHGQ